MPYSCNKYTFSWPSTKIRLGPSGIHIYNRKTGLNILLDEVKVPKTLWAAAPRHVSIALTNACDLTCPYCFAPKNADVLSFDRVTNWLDELEENGCLGVGFGGGEPTLYRHLVELCKYISLKTTLAVSLTTHGIHLSEALIDDLKGNIHFIRVSFDGVGNTYETLRGHSFSALCKNIKILRNIIPFGINYIVNRRTLQDLDNAAAFAAEFGAAEILLLPEQPVKGNGGIDAQTADALRQWVRRYKGPIPLTVSEVGSESLPICNPLENEKGLTAFAHIDSSGILKRSSFDEHGVQIDTQGVMHALEKLNKLKEKY